MRRIHLPILAVASLLSGAAAAQVAAPTVEVMGVIRTVEAGEIIGAEDLGMVEVTPTMARLVVANPEQVLGKEAKRQLQAGKPIRTYDVTDPQLVRKGQKVAIIVEKGSMTISASGKAMTGGAAGATVRVQNTASYALLEGEVAGPGVVKVTPGGR